MIYREEREEDDPRISGMTPARAAPGTQVRGRRRGENHEGTKDTKRCLVNSGGLCASGFPFETGSMALAHMTGVASYRDRFVDISGFLVFFASFFDP